MPQCLRTRCNLIIQTGHAKPGSPFRAGVLALLVVSSSYHFLWFFGGLHNGREMGNVGHCSPNFNASPGADYVYVQGAKAKQTRERNAEKSKGAKSQSKSNEKARNIVCLICKQPFVSFFLYSFL